MMDFERPLRSVGTETFSCFGKTYWKHKVCIVHLCVLYTYVATYQVYEEEKQYNQNRRQFLASGDRGMLCFSAC